MPKAKKSKSAPKVKNGIEHSQNKDRITHISRVVFEGYKSIDHLEIDLVKGLNILIGKNGTGKSNFLGLLDSLGSWIYKLYGSVITYEFYKSAEIRLITQLHREIKWYTERKVTLKRGGNKLGQQALFNSNTNSFTTEELTINRKKVFKNPKDHNIFRLSFGGILRLTDQIPTENGADIELIPIIIVKYNLPKSLEAIDIPGSITLDKNTLTGIGHTTLMVHDFVWKSLSMHYFFQIQKSDKIVINPSHILHRLFIPESIIYNVKKYSPIKNVRFGRNINIYNDGKTIRINNILLEFFVEGEWMPWSYLSDGTKRLFYIISEISYFKDAIILIEEPELGIHPDQFYLLMDFLKAEAKGRQIIMSTHSPEALNILNENELQNIVITKYSKGKGTTMSHLNKQQITKAKAYMKELDLSDYWLSSDLEE